MVKIVNAFDAAALLVAGHPKTALAVFTAVVVLVAVI